MDEAAPRIDSQEALEEVFNHVRRTYFPRWRNGGNWSIKLGEVPGRPNLRGRCDLETRIIWMTAQWRDDEIVEAVVIHEIVHAVVGPGHGIRFQRRMLKAAVLAEERGNAALAAALREDAEGWAATPTLRASEVYRQIRLHAGEFTHYEALRDALAEEYHMLPDEFDGSFRRARRVYDQVRGELEAEKRIQAQWLAAMRRQSD